MDFGGGEKLLSAASEGKHLSSSSEQSIYFDQVIFSLELIDEFVRLENLASEFDSILGRFGCNI